MFRQVVGSYSICCCCFTTLKLNGSNTYFLDFFFFFLLVLYDKNASAPSGEVGTTCVQQGLNQIRDSPSLKTSGVVIQQSVFGLLSCWSLRACL